MPAPLQFKSPSASASASDAARLMLASLKPHKAVLDRRQRLDTGRVVGVAFVNTVETARYSAEKIDEIIERCARILGKAANITFNFLPRSDADRADIRIQYEMLPGHTDDRAAGSSLIGLQNTVQDMIEESLGIPLSPNMTITLGSQTLERDILAVALHEFLHAIGSLHEHSSPNADFDWVDEDIIAGEFGTTVEDVEHNFTHRFQQADVECTDTFDPFSIMGYRIEDRWTKDGDGNPGAPGSRRTQLTNDTLSDQDKAFYAQAFPFPFSNRRACSVGRTRTRYDRQYKDELGRHLARSKPARATTSARREGHVHRRMTFLDDTSELQTLKSEGLEYGIPHIRRLSSLRRLRDQDEREGGKKGGRKEKARKEKMERKESETEKKGERKEEEGTKQRRRKGTERKKSKRKEGDGMKRASRKKGQR